MTDRVRRGRAPSTRVLFADAAGPEAQVHLVVALAIPPTRRSSPVDRAELIRSRQAATAAEAAPVIAAVERLGGSAARPSWLTNTVSARIPASATAELEAELDGLANVVSVTIDDPVEFEVPVLLEQDAEPVTGDSG